MELGGDYENSDYANDVETLLGELDTNDALSVELPDEMKRRLAEVVQRQGQARFRDRLISAYKGKCVITGCDAVPALEAAHISPYSGPTSQSPSHGLLLRADLHSLFDQQLIGIDPSSHTVAIADALIGTVYANLKGKKLALPSDERHLPDIGNMKKAWKLFLKTKSIRRH